MNFEFAYFPFFLSFSVGIEIINTFLHSVVASKTIPDSRPKWAKSDFKPKRRKNPTRWGSAYLYGLHKGVAPPPPGVQNKFGGDFNNVLTKREG